MSERPHRRAWSSTSPDETRALGHRLGKLVQPGDVLALYGDLGTGKTALTQGLAQGLGIRERVVSPTFLLVNEYPSPRGFQLRHMDCYRLPEATAVAEVELLGYHEWLEAADSVLVIEWADRIDPLLPTNRLSIHLWQGAQANARRLVLEGRGPCADRWGRELDRP